MATRNWPSEAIELARDVYPAVPSEALMAGRVVQSGRLTSMADALTDPDYQTAFAAAGKWRRIVGAPMLRDGTPVGAVLVSWPDPGETPPRQADLLKTFADQAVIAIENVRLFNETKDALEQQTATANILGVISRSVADTQPVFDAILASCERLFDGLHVGITLAGDDGLVRLVAQHGEEGRRAEFERSFPVPLSAEDGK